MIRRVLLPAALAAAFLTLAALPTLLVLGWSR